MKKCPAKHFFEKRMAGRKNIRPDIFLKNVMRMKKCPAGHFFENIPPDEKNVRPDIFLKNVRPDEKMSGRTFFSKTSGWTKKRTAGHFSEKLQAG